MSKLISQCCVCGKVTSITTTQDGSDKERVSHGYCGTGCANQTPVQIMYWDNKLGCRMLDTAHMTEEGRIFHKMEAVDTLVTWNKKEKRVDSLFWNDAMYEIAEFEKIHNDGHGNRLLIEAAKEGTIVVL